MLALMLMIKIRGSKPAWLVLHGGSAELGERRCFRMSLWGQCSNRELTRTLLAV